MPEEGRAPTGETIRDKLVKAFAPTFLEVIDESHLHKNHLEMKGLAASGTHFKVTIASPFFDTHSAVSGTRAIYKVLDSELRNGLHALALHIQKSKNVEN